MNIIIAAQPATFTIPLFLLFWSNVVAYILHIFEESVLPEVFVDKVRRLYFHAYEWKHFAGFNVMLLTVNVTAVLLYENLHGIWVIFPLGLLFERMLNGAYHLYETVKIKTFSSGLLTSVITWILGYFVIRYAILEEQIRTPYLISAVGIGVVMAFLILSAFLIPPLQVKLNKVFEKQSAKH